MSGYNNQKINAAYINAWQQNNPKLLELKTDGETLKFNNETINISNVYMQDLLINPNLFYNIASISSKVLFEIIKTHTIALKIKELTMLEKVRSWNKYEQNK